MPADDSERRATRVMSDQRFFLGTLSAAQADNWEICVERGLWGSGSSSHAKHAAKHVEAGDLLFVWLAKQGLFAVAEFTGHGSAVTNAADVPWPFPERYLNTFPIRPLRVLRTAIADEFEDHRSLRFRVQTHQVQSGLIKIDRPQAEIMAAALGIELRGGSEAREEVVVENAPPIPPAAVLDRPTGVTYVQPATSVVEAMLGLWRSAEISPSSDGVLLVVGDEVQREEFSLEVTRQPFAGVSERFRFMTPEELAADLRSQLGR